jgi:hypothetical protein
MEQALVDDLLGRIGVLCQGGKFWSYVIGYTSGPIAKRADAYRRVGFDGLVSLADGLTSDEALWLEQHLFRACVANRKSKQYERYHEAKRDLSYRRSDGGRRSKVDPNSRLHSVYVAWCDQR